MALSVAIPPFGGDERSDILNRIQAPKFPDREFDITKFGAMDAPADGGKKDSTEAIGKAIAACAAAGGGRGLSRRGTESTS